MNSCGEYSYIWYFKRVIIVATKFEKSSLFNSDDLAAVAVAKASYFVMQSFVED